MRGSPGIDVSYAVSRDAAVISWRHFLTKEYRTDLEWVAARDLSVRWQTNAVADVSVYLPRYVKHKLATGTPKNYGLQVLNKKFAQAVWCRDRKLALQLYEHIQKRGLELTMDFINNETVRESFATAS